MNSNPVPDFIQPKFKCFCGCLINYGSVKKHWKSDFVDPPRAPAGSQNRSWRHFLTKKA